MELTGSRRTIQLLLTFNPSIRSHARQLILVSLGVATRLV
jgi:hypothetical protein